MEIELLNIDCMEYMASLPDNAFDLAIVDPPYGIKGTTARGNGGRFESGISHIHNKNWNDEKPSKKYFNELFRVSKNIIIWGANNFRLQPSEYFLIWDKMQTVKNFASAEYAWTNIKMPAKVFRYPIHHEIASRKILGKIHPAQKPVKLYEWTLDNYAKPGQRILDTHLGSGSSAIAAHYFGCHFVGCEIDKDYFDAAKARFERETRQLALAV